MTDIDKPFVDRHGNVHPWPPGVDSDEAKRAYQQGYDAATNAIFDTFADNEMGAEYIADCREVEKLIADMMENAGMFNVSVFDMDEEQLKRITIRISVDKLSASSAYDDAVKALRDWSTSRLEQAAKQKN
jgi:hypothetical protein